MSIQQQTSKEDLEYQKCLQKLKREFDEKWYKKAVVQTVVSWNDFQRFRTIGTGSFGRVVLAQYHNSDNYYAIKILDKTRIVNLKQVQHTVNEKHVLESINFPFLIGMQYYFKDYSYLYFVLPFINGGEMFTHLRKNKRFDEKQSKFYGAQVALALEYLHYVDLIYRDLKPENILIDFEGCLKLTDFGFCKMVKDRTWTLCGTPEYIAPEIIMCKGYGKSVDWWSYGVLLYEMTAGYPPFYAQDTMKIYEKIVSGKYKVPNHFSEELRELVFHLLQTDLSRRYGNLKNGANDIKMHNWFKDINFWNIYNRKVRSPFIPPLKSQGDATNFEFYDEVRMEIATSDKYTKEFGSM